MAVKSTNYQVGLSNTNSQNFNIRTGLDGTLRVYRGSDTSELNEVLRIDANNALSADGMLGIGQTWQNLTSSRVIGVAYTNTTNRPIVVSYLCTSTAAFLPRLVINGTLQIQGVYADSGINYTGVTAIVPPGATYSASVSSGTASLYEWRELR